MVTAALAFGLAHSFSLRGADSADASGELDLNGISLTPSSGSLSWGAWTLNSFSSVANSDGAADLGSQTGSTATSASATIPNATTTTSANLSGLANLSGQITGSVNLPSGVSASASVGNAGNFSSWEDQLSIVGASGPVLVTVQAMLKSSLSAFTDSMGTVLENDVIFNLNVDGQNVVTFYDSLTAGPNQSLSHPLSASNPAGTVTLDPSVPHDVYILIDDEQEAVTVPDGSSSLVLMLISLGALGAGPRGLGACHFRREHAISGDANRA